MRGVLIFLTKWLRLGRLRRVGVRSTVEIAFPSTVDSGKFARYTPFGDGRELIVRRGASTGFHYGFEKVQRRVKLQGGEFDLITYESILSPPVLMPGQAVIPDTEDSYRPVYDVLYLPEVEVMIPRRPVKRGFTDAEVGKILSGIRVS